MANGNYHTIERQRKAYKDGGWVAAVTGDNPDGADYLDRIENSYEDGGQIIDEAAAASKVSRRIRSLGYESPDLDEKVNSAASAIADARVGRPKIQKYGEYHAEKMKAFKRMDDKLKAKPDKYAKGKYKRSAGKKKTK